MGAAEGAFVVDALEEGGDEFFSGLFVELFVFLSR